MEPQRRNAPVWLKLLVGFLVLSITSWSMPKSAPGVANGTLPPRGLDWLPYYNDQYIRTSPIQQVVLSLGLWQSWDMFAPNPTSSNVWGDAVVVRRDGSEDVYQFPRVYTQGFARKYVTERYRKYYERAHLDAFSFMREPFARRIARVMDEPGNPVVRVTLRRHYIDVPRMEPFRLYASNLWEKVRAGQATNEDWLPTPPPVPDFQIAAYYVIEIPPEP